MTTATTLKERFKSSTRDAGANNPANPWQLRLYRAISWLQRSEQETDDLDARFIFQWVALNAAYAREFSRDDSERQRFEQFVAALVQLDAAHSLHDALFRQFSGPIRTLIDNRFVFQPFWTALREHDGSERWKAAFSHSKKLALQAIASGDTATVLSVIFDRLYVLRNQLVHGGATWASSVNRDQVRDGAAILAVVVPQVLAIMLDHPEYDFGEVLYPVV